MAIYLDSENGKTICVCNSCGTTEETSIANGVVVSGWGTGQIWIDVSLSNIRQTAICFCTSCVDVIKAATAFEVKAV